MQGAQIILPVGSVVKERYIVEGLLGKGGFGAVYLVRDQRVRVNQFALKEVSDPNTEDKQRFAFEGEVLKRLDYPALPRVYRAFEDNSNHGDRLYMLMDYIEGPNLEELRQRQPQKRLPLQIVMDIMAPIVGAISYLHQQQPPIIHRDIKPANIIVPDEYNKSVLVDFGIAKEYDQEGTTTAIRRCSPGYGAPEQYARGTNVQTDIYGLAATFYALLTGTVPADALYRMTQIGSRQNDPLEPVNELAPNVPQHVAAAIHRAMAINIHERFASVDAFWQALQPTSLTGNAPSYNGNNDVTSTPTIITPATAIRQQHPTRPLLATDTASRNGIPIASPAPVMPVTAMPVTSAPVVNNATLSPQIEVRYQRQERRRRPGVLFFLAFIALLVLLVGLLFATGVLPGMRPGTSTTVPPIKQTHVVTTPTSQPTASPTHTPVPTPTPTTAPSPTPTTAPTATPTSAPTSVPPAPVQLHSFYAGTINDAIGPTIANMQLKNIIQNGTNIQGYFAVYKPLQGSNPFSGTVSSNSVQFTVQSYGGHLPLAFTGTVQTNGSISGTYCSVDTNGCNDSQGYGTWQVSP
ncbi:MAG TPA: hypothetical protein DHW02_23545 [Ktedonobacter sp.]|nr:hypothetical protein [Ktedonobacter sp.]